MTVDSRVDRVAIRLLFYAHPIITLPLNSLYDRQTDRNEKPQNFIAYIIINTVQKVAF